MRILLILTIFSTYFISAQGFFLNKYDCSAVQCRPGRECRSEAGSEPQCVCRLQCPEHWKPVCGSDGVSYDNHCELHRSACVSGTHISPLHSGFCRRDRERVIARQEFVEELSLWNDTEQQIYHTSVPLPSACFENDRNRLREFIMSWFSLNSRHQSWYSHGMSYAEQLWGHFYSLDTNGDKFGDSQEMLNYLNNNKSEEVSRQKSNQLRQLCLDALVEEGDTNFDWRLSFDEFKDLLSDTFVPSTKVCNLNKRKYEDGAETIVECNGCVCACGKWICTSKKCPEKHEKELQNHQSIKNNAVDNEDDSDEYYDEDDEYYEEDPEDDPDVEDINWF